MLHLSCIQVNRFKIWKNFPVCSNPRTCLLPVLLTNPPSSSFLGQPGPSNNSLAKGADNSFFWKQVNLCGGWELEQSFDCLPGCCLEFGASYQSQHLIQSQNLLEPCTENATAFLESSRNMSHQKCLFLQEYYYTAMEEWSRLQPPQHTRQSQ